MLRSSVKNQTLSPLLRLPAELRIQIFTYALSDWQVCMFYSYECGQKVVQCKPVNGVEGPWISAKSAILGLPSTCRQLRSETAGLPFTLNNALGWSTVWCMHVLFKRLGEERCMILETVCIFLDDE
jgi:hypothetical protein